MISPHLTRNATPGLTGRALTNKTVVPRHLGPLLGWLNFVVYVHRLVRLELATRRKWRHLKVDLVGEIIFRFTILGAPALLLFLIPIFRVDNLDGEWAFCPIVLVLDPLSLAVGRRHCFQRDWDLANRAANDGERNVDTAMRGMRSPTDERKVCGSRCFFLFFFSCLAQSCVRPRWFDGQ